MAISYPLSLPTTKSPVRVSISASSSVAISRSPWSYASQVQQYDGQLWFAKVDFPIMERADAAQYISFLLKLNGQQGTMLLGDASAGTPRGAATGTPLVKGASQTGQVLITDGWTNSITGIMKAGDYIQVGQRLHMILTDADSNGSGEATFDIWPRLRESPGDNDAIVTANCKGLFRLTGNTNDIFDANVAKLYTTSFTAVEAL